MSALRKPKRLSPGEELFAFHLRAAKLTAFEREYVFALPRKWRFDFANVDKKVAVEIEGGIWNNGAHTRGAHFESDAEKYNMAAILGWRVLRFSTGMVESGVALRDTVAVLKAVGV